MATSGEYAQGLLDEERTPVVAESYDPDVRDVNADTDTVQGQLGTLLDQDSDYMKRATTTGEQYAQSRGLLNSSIGAQASQAAAIDAALPIAQQDASIYMTQGLANQDALNAAGSTNATLGSQANISEAANITALQDKALSTMAASDLQSQSDAAQMDRTLISEAGATERTEMSETGATERSAASDVAQMERLELSETSAMDRTILGEAGMTARQESQEAANVILQNMEISSEDRTNFIAYYDSRGTYQMAELARLAEHEDLDTDEKTQRIDEINASYIADIQLLSDVFAIPLNFGDEDGLVNPGEPEPEPEPDASSWFSKFWG